MAAGCELVSGMCTTRTKGEAGSNVCMCDSSAPLGVGADARFGRNRHSETHRENHQMTCCQKAGVLTRLGLQRTQLLTITANTSQLLVDSCH